MKLRAAAFTLAFGLIALAASPAPAQDNGLGGFLMRMLRGGGGAPPALTPPASIPTPLHRPRKKPADFLSSTQTRSPGVDLSAPPPTPGQTPAATPAVAPTFFVDVVGDSLAGQIAQGLVEQLADRPEIATANKTRDSSGLVRDDYYDWGKAAADLAAGPDKIDFLVVMIGSNDSQPLRDGADVLDPLSDRWKALYEARAAALLAPFKAKKIPIVWVGLPPMHSDRLSADMSKLNALDRETAEAQGATYVDLWDAFANANGGFDAFGPDVSGENVKLRGVDGVHFTKAGAEKAASFIAAEIRRSFDKGKPSSDVATLPPDIEKAARDINAEMTRDTETAPAPMTPAALAERPIAGPILSLTARPTSPDGALESADAAPRAETALVAKVLRAGQPATPVAGRADDFSAVPPAAAP